MRVALVSVQRQLEDFAKIIQTAVVRFRGGQWAFKSVEIDGVHLCFQLNVLARVFRKPVYKCLGMPGGTNIKLISDRMRFGWVIPQFCPYKIGATQPIIVAVSTIC